MSFNSDLILIENRLKDGWNKKGPGIMIFLGSIGMVASVVSAVKETPKAMKLLEARKEHEGRELTRIETVDTTWKTYLPTGLLMIASLGSIYCGSHELIKRGTVLSAAYLLADNQFSEYREKVKEVVGPKKEQAIRDEIAKDRIESAPVQTREVIITSKGDTLCYDTYSGRYFKADIDELKRIQVDLGNRLLTETYITINDYFDCIGLEPLKYGEEMGWQVGDRIEFDFSSQLATDGTPCLVVDYKISPLYSMS